MFVALDLSVVQQDCELIGKSSLACLPNEPSLASLEYSYPSGSAEGALGKCSPGAKTPTSRARTTL